MRDLTRFSPEELRAEQERAVRQILKLTRHAAAISDQMTRPRAGGELYRRMHDQWSLKLAEAQRWGDLVLKLTAEIERRAQARKAAS
jgi:hypothetical protein